MLRNKYFQKSQGKSLVFCCDVNDEQSLLFNIKILTDIYLFII